MKIFQFVFRVLQFRSLWFCIALFAMSATGCGEKSNTVSVNGNVTYSGQPLTHGSVTFFPPIGRPVNAPLAADGAYGAELAPGEYTVTVSYTEPLPAGFKEGDPLPTAKLTLPPEYDTRARSTLKATVAENQSDPIDFTLK